MAMSPETASNRGTAGLLLWLGCQKKYHKAAMAATPIYNTMTSGKKTYLIASRNTSYKEPYLISSSDLRSLAKYATAPRKSTILKKMRRGAVCFQQCSR